VCPYLDRLFPAATASGPIEKSTLKKQHPKAYALAKLLANIFPMRMLPAIPAHLPL
jgi:ABC-type transport system involved in cytochrome c biogenesis permease component